MSRLPLKTAAMNPVLDPGTNADHGGNIRGLCHIEYPALALVVVLYINNPHFLWKNLFSFHHHHHILHQLHQRFLCPHT